MPEEPLNLIHNNLDKEIKIILKDKREIQGTLRGYDKNFDITIEDAQLLEDDQVLRTFGKAVVRRNNILMIRPTEEDI